MYCTVYTVHLLYICACFYVPSGRDDQAHLLYTSLTSSSMILSPLAARISASFSLYCAKTSNPSNTESTFVWNTKKLQIRAVLQYRYSIDQISIDTVSILYRYPCHPSWAPSLLMGYPIPLPQISHIQNCILSSFLVRYEGKVQCISTTCSYSTSTVWSQINSPCL